MSKKTTVIVVAYPDRGEGNDPEPFFFFFFFFRGVGSFSQPRLNIFTVGNMGVMICLGQGGLRSLSASSYTYVSVLSTVVNLKRLTHMRIYTGSSPISIGHREGLIQASSCSPSDMK